MFRRVVRELIKIGDRWTTILTIRIRPLAGKLRKNSRSEKSTKAAWLSCHGGETALSPISLDFIASLNRFMPFIPANRRRTCIHTT